MNKLATFFEFDKNQTSWKSESLGGLTSFLATFYIIIVNPSILANAGMPAEAVVTATIMITALSTILMGVYANNPIVLAPGMGINAFLAFNVVLGMKISWQVALGIVFWSGILFLILSVLNVRTAIVNSIPQSLRYGISAGIGLFIAFIGLKNGGVIIASPATLVQMAPLDAKAAIFLLGLTLTAAATHKRITGHLVLGIMLTFLMAIPLGRWYGEQAVVNYNGFFGMPDFSVFFQMDLKNSLQLSVFPVILAFVFTDMFDTISTLVGVSEAGGLLDQEGNPRNIKKALTVDAIATTVSGLFGTSPTTSYIESAAGVEAGAKTGAASLVAGLLFLPFLFLSPVLSSFPPLATAPVLVVVGLFMLGPMARIDWSQIDEAFAAFVAMLLIPLSFSITHGITIGFLTYCGVKILTGKWRDISPAFGGLNFLILIYLVTQ